MTSTYALKAALVAGLAGAAWLVPSLASAQTCRARAIITAQCTWFALEELRGDKRAAARAQHLATSDLIDGCSQGQYQMVLLRGNSIIDGVVRRLRARGVRSARAVQSACAAAAARL